MSGAPVDLSWLAGTGPARAVAGSDQSLPVHHVVTYHDDVSAGLEVYEQGGPIGAQVFCGALTNVSIPLDWHLVRT